MTLEQVIAWEKEHAGQYSEIKLVEDEKERGEMLLGQRDWFSD